MLSLNAEQMRAVELAQAENFASDLARHLAVFAPLQAASMGPAAVLRLAQDGLQRASVHGFTLRGPARFYVELMFMFGSAFDTDPQYEAWVWPQLNNPGTDELVRADRLHQAAVHYVEQTSGPGHVYERQALERLRRASFEDLAAYAGGPSRSLVPVLGAFHPEKLHCVGEEALARLARSAYANAELRGPDWALLGPLLAGLMFTFGHGCATDPQFPWIAKALARPTAENGPTGTAVRARLENLFDRFLTFAGSAGERLAGA